jgi:hypothetical protein
VRAFGSLLLIVYLVESVVFTLHSTRGSYFHSLAAFLPYGVALGVAGSIELLRSTDRARAVAAGGIVAAALLSVFALIQWDASFNAPYRARVAALPSIPAGRFYAIDAAAWHWIAGREVIVTPADGLPCSLRRFDASAIVLERAHFSVYDEMYAGTSPTSGLGAAVDVGDIRIFPLSVDQATTACP